jgi:acetyltransferase-like isoleucine patch superfamily enzyme
MKQKLKLTVQLLILFLPWTLRRWILTSFIGYVIHPTARIGKSIILAKEVRLDAYSRIHSLVICKNIDRLVLCEDSGIASMTYITGTPTSGTNHFRHVLNRRCELVLERSSGITSRHYIDCTGGVYVGEFTTVAGIRSQILSHSIDVYQNRQDAASVHIGKYCFIGTGCIILPGSSLPDYSVLGAGGVLAKQQSETHTLYVGCPARPIKKLDTEEVLYFKRSKHFVE